MSLRTTAQLAQDFPVNTTANIIASSAKFDLLLRDGFVGSFDEVSQIRTAIYAAIAPLAETFSAPVAAYSGTAGAVDRKYSVVATYLLPVPVGGAQNNQGRYLNFIGGKSPHGEGSANAQRVQDPGTDRFYGLPSPATDVPSGAATLDATDFVTITTPAAKNIPGVRFDIVVQYAANGPYFTVAANVAPGTAYVDNGGAQVTSSPYYGMTYTPRAGAEIGYDPAAPQKSGGTAPVVVYGPLNR